MSKAKSKPVKYRFSCKGPKELTRYNAEYNAKLVQSCRQREIFQPHLTCFHSTESGQGPCALLDIQSYK